jgi:hypothetical protein
MNRYHGPKDYLDAARSTDTSAEELEALAVTEYPFVRAALAKNPSTPPRALSSLLSANLDRYPEQEVAEALAARTDASGALLERLAEALSTHLHGGRDSRAAFSAAVALCSNEAAPFDAIRRLLDPAVSKPVFRKVVARETRRADVLALLASDVSSTVAERARRSISQGAP